MGFLDIFKKNRNAQPYAMQPYNAYGQGNAFRGDLALPQEAAAQKSGYPGYDVSVRDSADAIVHMTFAPPSSNIWVCPECGTNNEEDLNGCVVCGLRK